MHYAYFPLIPLCPPSPRGEGGGELVIKRVRVKSRKRLLNIAEYVIGLYFGNSI